MEDAPVRVIIEGDPELVPTYESEHAAGADLRCGVDEIRIGPGQRVRVPTGIRIALPPGYEAQVRPRSGLAFNAGVTVVNAPGTIDADYRGEVLVALINLSDTEHTFRRGDRVAQLVVAPVARASFVPGKLPASARGEGGFGSTG